MFSLILDVCRRSGVNVMQFGTRRWGFQHSVKGGALGDSLRVTALLCTVAILCLIGCSTTSTAIVDYMGSGQARETGIVTGKGYVCSSGYTCPNGLRCYRRYPSSTGRCVTQEYFSNHIRGCYVDDDCLDAEECIGRTPDRAGECVQTYRREPEKKNTLTESPAPE